MATETTLARAELRRKNEEVVIREAARKGQIFIATMRVMLLVLLAVMNVVLAALGQRKQIHQDPPALLAMIGYAVFAVTLLVVLRRLKRDPAANRVVVSQMLHSLIDFGWVAFMAWRQMVVHNAIFPEIGAALVAVFICFSMASYGTLNQAFHTVVACVAWLCMAKITGELTSARLVPIIFVMVCMLVLAVMMGGTRAFITDMFLRLRQRDNLMHFLPKQVAERAMDFASSLAPVQREATVLFTDIRGFTGLSEGMEPRAVLEFLDDYFGQMGQIVKGREGILNKFIGDGLLAFWNLPERDEKHAENALKAALDMRKKLAEINAHRQQFGQEPLRIGIGVHTGVVAAGMLGGADQHEYTVIGDAVNVASRIEGLNKQHGTDILVSETTWQLVGGRFPGRCVAEQAIRGRERPVTVFLLEGEAAPAQT